MEKVEKIDTKLLIGVTEDGLKVVSCTACHSPRRLLFTISMVTRVSDLSLLSIQKYASNVVKVFN